jgi:hypothetical protein
MSTRLPCVALVTMLSAASACGGGGDDTAGWTSLDAPQASAGYTALWVFGPDDVWLASSDDAFHWDGLTWTTVATPLAGAYEDFWGIAPDDLWLVNWDEAAHWDGQSWTEFPLGANEPSGSAQAIWASGPTDVWVGGGTSGEAVHWDGAMWTLYNLQTTFVLDLWGSAPGDVWAVGAGGFFHWDGSAWTEVPGPPELAGESPHSLWGFGPNDVFAVGSGNGFFHWNGSAWTGRSNASDTVVDGYLSVWGAAPNDVWAVGDSAIAHFDGVNWSADHTDMFHNHGGVHGSSATDVWIASWHSADFAGLIFHGPP